MDSRTKYSLMIIIGLIFTSVVACTKEKETKYGQLKTILRTSIQAAEIGQWIYAFVYKRGEKGITEWLCENPFPFPLQSSWTYPTLRSAVKHIPIISSIPGWFIETALSQIEVNNAWKLLCQMLPLELDYDRDEL